MRRSNARASTISVTPADENNIELDRGRSGGDAPSDRINRRENIIGNEFGIDRLGIGRLSIADRRAIQRRKSSANRRRECDIGDDIYIDGVASGLRSDGSAGDDIRISNVSRVAKNFSSTIALEKIL